MSGMLVRQEAPAVEVAPLSLAEVCDACGHSPMKDHGTAITTEAPVSRAYVRVVFPSGLELLFCGHHYYVYEVQLAALGVRVRDERAKLLEGIKPGASV